MAERRHRHLFVKTGLADATTYSFQVRAVNDVATGPGGNTVNARTPGAPAPVGGVALDADNARVDATWSAPGDNGNPITGYDVDISPGAIRRVGGTSTTFTGLTNGQHYDIRVRACNEIGCGGWSPTETAVPRAPLAITVSKGNAVSTPSCSTSSCAYVFVDAEGLSPGATYEVDCFSRERGQFDTGNSTVRATDAGTVYGDLSCYFGYPGEHVYVTLGSHRSDTYTWR